MIKIRLKELLEKETTKEISGGKIAYCTCLFAIPVGLPLLVLFEL